MGASSSRKSSQSNEGIKKAVFEKRTDLISKNEIDELYTYESAICKIRVETLKNGEKKVNFGTGFFCEINDKNIPFNKALFTNNHILNENSIEVNKRIEFEYCEKKQTIKITKDRKVFTTKELDYTCIEILDEDKINKLFNIDETIFNDKNSLIKKEIFILQYPHDNLCFNCGKILDIKDNIIEHNVPTKDGSSGSPLIKRYNNNLIVGIHWGTKKKDIESNDKYECNLAIPFDVIIKDIINNVSQNNNNKSIQYKINLIYNKKNEYENCNRIFGSDFVKDNRDNIALIINGEKSELVEECELKKGRNNIQIIINNQLTNLEDMFRKAISLENIEELKYLNTEKVNIFEGMFYDCKSLSDIKGLQNWNVSNGNNFEDMFYYCKSLSDIKPLKNWNVSNGNNFKDMFYYCESLSDIKPLQNWNVSNGNDFSYMFSHCESLSDIKPLENWNVSNGNHFLYMFSQCSSSLDLKPLKNWKHFSDLE